MYTAWKARFAFSSPYNTTTLAGGGSQAKSTLLPHLEMVRMGKTGKTFYIHTTRLTEKALDKLPPYFSGDFVRDPYFVPNGKWVLEGVSYAPGYHQRFVGAHKELKRIELEFLYSLTARVIWVGDNPFGMLRWDKTDETWLSTGGISFESARQVNNGQLGQLAPIPKLERVHELGSFPSRHQSKVAWARVSDLTKVSGLSFAEIVKQFWPFVNPDYQPWHHFPAVLKMVLGASAEDIKAQKRRVEEFTQKDLLDKLQNNSSFYDNDWIPASLGRTILRLIALGYKPTGI